MFKRIISLALTLSFGLQQTVFAYTASLNLSGYLNQGPNLSVSDKFRPVSLRYFSYQPQTNDFKILLDKGDTKDIADSNLKGSASVLLDYFKIGLSLPNDKFWVNLRPDSEDQIIDEELAKTDLGKVMLEADLKLKQDTSLFTSPQTPQGKEYWNKLYKRAGELFGTENITIPTLTRPWIVPGEIILRESNDNSSGTTQGAYIYKANLKVMLEEDYLRSQSHQVTKSPVNQTEYSFNDPRLKELNQYSTQLIRELILPKLTQKVNSSKDYANLRQVYFSLILARWFKETFSPQSTVHSPQNDSYIKMIDSHSLTNLTSKEAWDKTTYFNAYQKSFQEGEYNLSEQVYTPTGQVIRRYMSGGMVISPTLKTNGAGTYVGGPDNIVSLVIEGKDKVTLNSSDLEIDKGIMKDGVYQYLKGSQSILSGFYLSKAMEIINANLSGKIDFSQAIKDLGDLSISGLSTSGKDTTFRATSLRANLAAINLAQKYDFSSVILIKFITYLARLTEPAFNPKVTDGITRPTLGLEDTQEKLEELKRILTAYNQKDAESIIKEGEQLVSASFSEQAGSFSLASENNPDKVKVSSAITIEPETAYETQEQAISSPLQKRRLEEVIPIIEEILSRVTLKKIDKKGMSSRYKFEIKKIEENTKIGGNWKPTKDNSVAKNLNVWSTRSPKLAGLNWHTLAGPYHQIDYILYVIPGKTTGIDLIKTVSLIIEDEGMSDAKEEFKKAIKKSVGFSLPNPIKSKKPGKGAGSSPVLKTEASSVLRKLTVEDINLAKKKVISREEFNVSLGFKDGERIIVDDTRVKEALPNIKHITGKAAKLIISAHLGRPQEEIREAAEKILKEKWGIIDAAQAKKLAEAQIREKLSLDIVAKRLQALLGEETKVHFNKNFLTAKDAQVFIDKEMKDGEILVLENVRFNKAEEMLANSEKKFKDGKIGKPELADARKQSDQFTADLFFGMDVFVLDGFGVAHRKTVSVTGAPHHIPRIAGLLVKKEMEYLDMKDLDVAIIGGSKVSDKIKVIENLLKKAKTILIGGAMTFAFEAAMGKEIGDSVLKNRETEIAIAKQLLEKAKGKIILPVDHKVARGFSNDAEMKDEVPSGQIEAGWMGLDIGANTIIMYENIIKKAKTVLWNGPPGVFEFDNFSQGTRAIAGAMVKVKENGGRAIVGGGDSATAVVKFGLADKMSHVSTGGGAAIEYIEKDGNLPGILALSDKDEAIVEEKIVGLPLTIEDLDELRGIYIPFMTEVSPNVKAQTESLLRNVNAARKLIYGNSAEEISLDEFTSTGRRIYNYCTRLLSELKIVIFSSEYVNLHGIDAEKLNEYSAGVDEKSKKIQELLAGIKDLVTAYKAYKLKSDSQTKEYKAGSPLINPVVKESLFESIIKGYTQIKFDELEKVFAEQINQMQEYFASNYIKTFFNGLKEAEVYSAKKDLLFSALDRSEWKDVEVAEYMKRRWNELDDFLAQGLKEYYLNAAIEVREKFTSEDEHEKAEIQNAAKQVIHFLRGYQAADRLFDSQLDTVAKAWDVIRTSSSSLIVSERDLSKGFSDPKKVLGGIDFRSMNMLIQPQGSFASSSLDFSLPALSKAEIESFDLDTELAAIQKMASSGIAPSDERLKEYLAVCFAKERTGPEIDNLKLCLLDVFEQQQLEAKETPNGYKEVLVIADTRGYVLKEGRLAASKQKLFSLN